jgi:transcriptional regulator with XRE-family HTH domain
MDVCLAIQQRLKELGLEQRDLAEAAQVTESYISQLLTRKKAPPATNRTDIYEKMSTFLRLPRWWRRNGKKNGRESWPIH